MPMLNTYIIGQKDDTGIIWVDKSFNFLLPQNPIKPLLNIAKKNCTLYHVVGIREKSAFPFIGYCDNYAQAPYPFITEIYSLDEDEKLKTESYSFQLDKSNIIPIAQPRKKEIVIVDKIGSHSKERIPDKPTFTTQSKLREFVKLWDAGHIQVNGEAIAELKVYNNMAKARVLIEEDTLQAVRTITFYIFIGDISAVTTHGWQFISESFLK